MIARALLATALVSLLTATGFRSAEASRDEGGQQIVDDQQRRQAVRHYRAGQEFMAAENFDRAAEEFSQAARLDPLFTLAHYFLGQAYVSQQRYASAIKAYLDCIEACRSIYALRQTNRFEAEKRRDDDIRELRETVALAQAQARRAAGSGLGLRAVQLEQQLQNLERTRTSIDAPFQAPGEVLLALGSAYFHNGQIEQAEFEWQVAVQVNPQLGEAHNNLAVVYMRTGRLEAAEREMKLAEKYGVRVNPQFKADLKTAMAKR
jgi:tetratricopeptide (TPR) repeat protein